MNRPNLQMFLLLLPIVLVAAAIYAATVLDTGIPLTPEETTVMRFRPAESAAEFRIHERPALVYSPEIRGPFRIAERAVAPETVAGDTGKPSRETYRVSGIFITEDEKRAVISNQFVREGTRLNGRQIEKIERDRISLNENGERSWLILESP